MRELTLHLGASNDARDLHSEPALKCAVCDRGNPEVSWVLPGLCSACALHVTAVTAHPGGAEQPAMFDLWGMHGQQQPALFEGWGGRMPD